MKFLLENQTMVTDDVLFEHNKYLLAGVFTKVNAYNRRARAAVSESAYFNNKFAYNPDIMFTLEEQDAVGDMLHEMRAHIMEQMDLAIKQALLEAGAWDKAKRAFGNAKQYLGDKYDKLTSKFSAGINAINNLIKKGISSVKEFIGALGDLFTKLGDTIHESLKKLGAFSSDETAGPEASDSQATVDAEYLKDVPQEEHTFFKHVVEYITDMLSNDKDKAKQIMNEGLIDSIANNKFLQFVIGHRKGKRWGIWHTILVSIVGSLIVGIVLPMLLYSFGVAAGTIVVVCTAVRIIWMSRGLVKVLLNRYLNKKPGEKFFDFWTCFGIFMSVVPLAVLQIPAVHEWMTDAIKSAFHAMGLDKVIDSIEDWLAKIAEHFTGHNPTQGEEYREAGHWVKQQVESLRNAGGAHTDLMTGGSGHDYVDSLFSGSGKSDLSSFTGDTNALKTWMESIVDGKFTSSLSMLNGISPLSGDAPLTAMLDGNTFQHVSREALTKSIETHAAELGIHCDLVNVTEDLLRDQTKGFAGTAYALVMDGNATSENAGIFKELMTKVATDMHVHNVDSFGKIMNVIKDWGTVWVDGDLNHDTIHTLFDTISQCFRPMFLPWFDKEKWGEYSIRIGSNASGMPAYRVTEVYSVNIDKLREIGKDAPAVALLIKHMEDVQRQHKIEIKAAAEQEKEENDGKITKKSRGFFKHEVEKYNKNNDSEAREVMVICISGTVKKKNAKGKMVTTVLRNEPAVVFDINTMLCADIANWSRRRRNVPYLMKGLFSKLDFVPTKKNDNETKQFIYDMLNTTLLTSAKQCLSFGTGSMYVTTESDEDGKNAKYVPIDKANASKRFFDLGNFTVQEFCDILNEEKEPYSFFAGKYGEQVSMRVDKNTGELKKSSKENQKVIEKKRYRKEGNKFIEDKNGEYDYVDAKIIPFINRPSSAVWKELYEDKDIKALIFEDGKLNTDIFTDKTLNLKEFLYRPTQTFSRDDKVKLAESVNKYLKGKNKKEKMNAYNTFKSIVEIIWKHIVAQIQKNKNLEAMERK